MRMKLKLRNTFIVNNLVQSDFSNSGNLNITIAL